MLTVLLPNYKTPELTKLCLRSLRKYTDFNQIQIVAIDNASGDESLAYLRSLPWIKLIERSASDIQGMPPPLMHSSALDMALEQVETPYVISMHTDTIVHSPQWLDYLMEHITRSEKTAGVGSWKLETVPFWKSVGKALEDGAKTLIGRKHHEFLFLRSHCALYRTELLKKYTKGFGDGECAGSSIHKHLLAAGYELEFLPVCELSRYMAHLNHATMILNPKLTGRRTTSEKSFRKLGSKMNTENYRRILEDDSLDRWPEQ